VLRLLLGELRRPWSVEGGSRGVEGD